MDNPTRGVWSLTDIGNSITLDELPAVILRANAIYKEERNADDSYNPHSSGNSQSFNIAIVNEDGTETIAPMKQWLRKHMDTVDVQKNSRSVARLLIKQGWSSQQTPTEFRLYPPGSLPPIAEKDDPDGEDPIRPVIPTDDPQCSFKMEAELRDFLAHNLGNLKIDPHPSLHLERVEVSAGSGFIDILATDTDGAYYVFELKRAKTPDSVIGQVIRYMAWVTKNLANGKPVFGIIVAKAITDQLKDSLVIVPSVSLFEYQVAFTLKAATTPA